MSQALKRQPVPESWGRLAFCKGKDPALWDLDSPQKVYAIGRKHCVVDCTVRESCLRKGLSTQAVGVVRGGVLFDEDQFRKKRTRCLFCQYPVAPIKYNEEQIPVRDICWVCRHYAPCLAGCGRMVKRKPYTNSYRCRHCAK
jgi:hypothetical protein